MTQPLPQQGGSYTRDKDGELVKAKPAKPTPKPMGKTPAKGA
ncbi:hypothetical protein [Roseobacter insulae]|nr:hypothetical protein [Roseobacter insulae]